MRSLHRVALGLLLLASTVVGEAAPAVGSMACTGASNLTFNVSFLDLGITGPSSTGSSSSGAGLDVCAGASNGR
jgi:hypothetical protein